MIQAPSSTAGLHGTQPPSDWVKRWSHLIKPGGCVLDVACGYGRHARWFYERNHTLALVDRAQAAIDFIAITIPLDSASGNLAAASDIENGPWPFAGRLFDAVVVTHYLWRPLMPTLLASLAPDGVLIYETFAQGNETVGRPSRPDFLLRRAELLELCQGLRIVAFEDGFMADTASDTTPTGTNPATHPDMTVEAGAETSARFVQRIVAVREALPPLEAGAAPLAVRYRLA